MRKQGPEEGLELGAGGQQRLEQTCRVHLSVCWASRAVQIKAGNR